MVHGQLGIMMAEDRASGSPIRSLKIIPVFRRKCASRHLWDPLNQLSCHQELNKFSGRAISHNPQCIKVSRTCRCQRWWLCFCEFIFQWVRWKHWSVLRSVEAKIAKWWQWASLTVIPWRLPYCAQQGHGGYSRGQSRCSAVRPWFVVGGGAQLAI